MVWTHAKGTQTGQLLVQQQYVENKVAYEESGRLHFVRTCFSSHTDIYSRATHPPVVWKPSQDRPSLASVAFCRLNPYGMCLVGVLLYCVMSETAIESSRLTRRGNLFPAIVKHEHFLHLGLRAPPAISSSLCFTAKASSYYMRPMSSRTCHQTRSCLLHALPVYRSRCCVIWTGESCPRSVYRRKAQTIQFSQTCEKSGSAAAPPPPPPVATPHRGKELGWFLVLSSAEAT